MIAFNCCTASPNSFVNTGCGAYAPLKSALPPLKLPKISRVYAYCWSAENPVNPGVCDGVGVTAGVPV